MKLLERILLAVDFGDLTDVTLDQAVHLARRFDAEIIPIHAIEFVPYYAYEESISTIRKELEERLGEFTDRLRKAEVKVHAPLLQVGAAWDAIVNAADDFNVNLILLGAGRKSLAERILAGSTLEKVAKRARQPVWAMHPGDTRAEITSVLCAVDFSPSSDQALQTAIHICRAMGAELNVLHVDDGHSHYPNVPDLVLDLRHHQSDARREPMGEPELGTYLEGFDMQGLRVTTMLRKGDVDERIAEAVAQTHSDLLVMGAFGHGSLMHKLMGNTTEKMLRRATCSVMAVKYQDIFKVTHDSLELHTSEIDERLQQLIGRVEARYQDARAAAAVDDTAAAIAAYEDCVTLDPRFHPAWEALADMAAAAGDEARAADCRRRAHQARRYIWELLVKADIRTQHDIDV